MYKTATINHQSSVTYGLHTMMHFKKVKTKQNKKQTKNPEPNAPVIGYFQGIPPFPFLILIHSIL